MLFTSISKVHKLFWPSCLPPWAGPLISMQAPRPTCWRPTSQAQHQQRSRVLEVSPGNPLLPANHDPGASSLVSGAPVHCPAVFQLSCSSKGFWRRIWLSALLTVAMLVLHCCTAVVQLPATPCLPCSRLWLWCHSVVCQPAAVQPLG